MLAYKYKLTPTHIHNHMRTTYADASLNQNKFNLGNIYNIIIIPK